jgi:hypothetical protein
MTATRDHSTDHGFTNTILFVMAITSGTVDSRHDPGDSLLLLHSSPSFAAPATQDGIRCARAGSEVGGMGNLTRRIEIARCHLSYTCNSGRNYIMSAWCVLDRWTFSQPHNTTYDGMMIFQVGSCFSHWSIARSRQSRFGQCVPTRASRRRRANRNQYQPHLPFSSRPC